MPTIKGMKETEILLACAHPDLQEALDVCDQLREQGLACSVITAAVDFSKIIAVVMTSKTEEDRLLEDNPWIASELRRSSLSHLRVLPFILFDSRIEDLSTIYDASISDIYDDLFSDEFKPLAFDASNPEQSVKELRRVLALYYAK